MPKRQPDAFEEESACYHHTSKGCNISYYPVPKRNKQGNRIRNRKGKVIFVNKAVCETHHAKLCNSVIRNNKNQIIGKCNWEKGLHFGEMSKGYNT